MAVNAKNITDDEFFFGHKACAGCGGSLAVRAALKVLGPNAVCALPAGCMSAVGFNFPQLSFATVSYTHLDVYKRQHHDEVADHGTGQPGEVH